MAGGVAFHEPASRRVPGALVLWRDVQDLVAKITLAGDEPGLLG